MDVQLAVDAADRAFDRWSLVVARQRAASLRAIAQRIEDEKKTLARLATEETGKRFAESLAEVDASVSYFEWYADVVSADEPVNLVADTALRHISTHRPVGVAAVITPWNFPLSIPARKLAPVIGAGCTAVFKPSEFAPRTSLHLAEVIDESLPPGTVNTVITTAENGPALLQDSRIRAITFTGSTEVGRLIASQAAGRFQRTVLELGGSAPFVVLNDADVDDAINCFKTAKYRNNGQSCIAANQVWLQDGVADEFLDRLIDQTRTLRVGDPFDEKTDVGPLARQGAPATLDSLVDEARATGAETVVANVPEEYRAGNFVPPAVCIRPAAEAGIWHTEVFGPVVPCDTFGSLEQLIDRLNRDENGLAAYICTANRWRGVEIAQMLNVGVVGVNSATPNAAHVPFGGVGESGWGREGGRAGLAAFKETQVIATD